MEESEIRITSSSTPGTYIIPSLIYLFRQSYPYITVINHIQYTRSAISDVIGEISPWALSPSPPRWARTCFAASR